MTEAEEGVGLSEISLAPSPHTHIHPDEYEECDCVDLADDAQNRRPGTIAYGTVYESQEDAQKRGYFIPGLPVTATIVSCERDATGTTHLFNPYVYTVELEHGPYKWTIQRRYKEFHHLHNRLLLFRAAQKVKEPVRRIKDRRQERRLERSLSLDDDSNLRERKPEENGEKDRDLEEATLVDGTTPASLGDSGLTEKGKIEFIDATVSYSQSQTSPRDTTGDTLNGSTELKPDSGDKGVKNGASRWSKVIKAVKPEVYDSKHHTHHGHAHPPRHRNKACKLPHFPLTPDSVVSSENRGERKRDLEEYIRTVLHIPAYRNHPETAEFLEVCRYSFVHNLGSKTKEGLVKKRPGGRRAFIGWKRFCIENCAKWDKRWLMVKDSFVAYLDPDNEEVRCVLLFDRDFVVRSGPRETEGVKHSLMISNQHRNLLLRCESDRKAEDWRQAINAVAQSEGGKLWLDTSIRFGGTYPVREESWAQWFVDGRPFMAQAANMMELAREEILITDWWLSPEVHMKRPMLEGDKWRLDKILQRKAKQGVRVFVLLYKEVEMALGINSMYSKRILQGQHDNIRVLRHPDHVPGTGTYLWAHHEKLICIDQNIAFVGGIDLCYGRWDESHHRLTDLGSVHFQDRTAITGHHNLMGGMKAIAAMGLRTLSVEVDPKELEEEQHSELGGMKQIAAMTFPATTVLSEEDGEMSRILEEAMGEEGLDQVDVGPGVSGVFSQITLEDVASTDGGKYAYEKAVSMELQPPEFKGERSGSNSSRKSVDSKAPLAESKDVAGAVPDSGGTDGEQQKSATPDTVKKRGRFKMWAKKVQRSKSESEDDGRGAEPGERGTGTNRFTSLVESQMDFASVVKMYKEYVDSGKAQLDKQRGDTPPPERKHKNRLKKMIRQWKDQRKSKEFPDEDKDYNEMWDKIASSAPDNDEIDGSGKLWLGKDYVNFIFKDFVDLDMPFMDFIDRSQTQRMPWHDIHSVVYGSAARDVARHFIERWNSVKVEKMKEDSNYPFLLPKSYENAQVPRAFKGISQKCRVQIVRSSSEWSVGMNRSEDSIQCAYLHMIANAQHFIYIENQFFISLLNSSDVQNEISKCLYDRIIRAHEKGETFRVYVVLPLMPAFEGQLGATGGSALQAVLYWTYRSISKGPNALLENLASKVGDYSKYIVFCGLRTHDELCGQLVTELVYVHSKLIIVDDRCCLIGSANINDRSQVGKRDSEVAIYVEDTDFETSRMNGREFQAGKFSGSLRRYLFKEHMGLLPVPKGAAEPNNPVIDVADPVCDEFYLKHWLKIASINTDAYEKVFRCIPTDEVLSFEDLPSYQSQLPLAQLNKVAAKEQLRRTQGFLVLFPTRFLIQDSLAPSYTSKEGLAPTSLFT